MEKIPVRHLKNRERKLESLENFGIEDLVVLLDGKDMQQELHRHDFFYVLVLKKGRGLHDIDFKHHEISDHSVYFMKPGQVHRLTLKVGSEGYMMHFGKDFYAALDKTFTELLQKVSAFNFYQFEENSFQKVFSVLSEIYNEFSGKKEAYIQIIQANLCIFFIELRRQQNKETPDHTGLYLQEVLEKFLELVEIHITEFKRVSDYAKLMSLSVYQLNAACKAVLGKSASALIIEHILLETKRYLLATPNQINQVADLLGYEDVSYFIRFFKKHSGFSPEAFRQNFK